MSPQKNTLAQDINNAIFWSYAAVTLTTWGLAGFLPFFGLFIEGQTALHLGLEVIFLVTGSLGVAGLALVRAFLRNEPVQYQDRPRSSRIRPLVILASVWIVAYSAFHWLS